jgi:hypothetical protein
LSIVRYAAAVLALCASCGAWAGPPFLTDDPEPVEAGKWEVNSAVTGEWSSGQFSVGAPTIDINYGAAKGVQLHLQPRYSFVEDDSGRRQGLDDTEIGVKYRFIEIERGDAKTQVAIYPIYQAPTGARRLGEDRGRNQVFLPVWLQENVGKWTLYGGAGYRFNRAPQGKNSVFTGFTALYEISESLQLGGEIFRESARSEDAAAERGFNVGGALKLTKTGGLLFSAGRRTGDSTASLAYLGLQLRF